MNLLSQHYHQLVGLNHDWAIADVQLDVRNKTLTLPLEFVSGHVVCPECGVACPMKEHATERSWRHLDAMHFKAILTLGFGAAHVRHAEWRQISFHGPISTGGSLWHVDVQPLP